MYLQLLSGIKFKEAIWVEMKLKFVTKIFLNKEVKIKKILGTF
jgi:hypothetical protein